MEIYHIVNSDRAFTRREKKRFKKKKISKWNEHLLGK